MKKTKTHFNRSHTFLFTLTAVNLSQTHLINSGFQKISFLSGAAFVYTPTNRLEESITNNKICV